MLRAGAVLITAGIGEFTPRPLPAGDGWLGRGMVHFVPSLQAHADQHVVVVGGGDSAFDWVLALHPIAASVTLVHRRARFRAAESIVRQARELGIRIITDAEVTRAASSTATARSSVDRHRGQGRGEPMVLPARRRWSRRSGFTADLGPIESWGLEIDHRAIAVDSTMATRETGSTRRATSPRTRAR